MARHEPVRRFAVAMLAPALGQHVFFLRFQHREPPDLFEISGKAGFAGQDRQGSSLGHDSALLNGAPASGGRMGSSLYGANGRSSNLAPAAYTVKSRKR